MRLVFFLAVSLPAQTLVVDNSRAVNSFSPVRALGAAVDRLTLGVAEKELTGPMLQVLLDSGWQSISYRQNTELHGEAWHWNPQGTWSDPSGKGYFTGSTTPGEPIRHSYGYALPHRGTTRHSRNGGLYFSRLTDGDAATYWKSNPYLTRAFTGEDDSLHPQWVQIDLGSIQPVNAIRIVWAAPYATHYSVQFWTGGDQSPRRAMAGSWKTFPDGVVTNGRGRIVTLPLARSSVSTRYVRIWMTASSNSCDTHGSSDRRNCVGYAIGEVSIGTIAAHGKFQDLVKHIAGAGQTTTICSSVDPWHEPSDVNEKAGEQVGFDFFFASGVTRGLPAMVPVAMLYATPEDAAAEIAYLEKRKYPISYVELGEEPDGQRMLPEDYAALYVQWAAAIHKIDPSLKLGGPVFEGVNEDIKVWPDANGKVSWFGRFLDYLKSHGRIADLGFMSFEHYPYTPCQSKWEDLYREPELITHIMDVWKDDGLPPGVPMLMTEGNVSSRGGITAVDMFGGLWLADYIGAFFTAGGAASFYFHLVSSPLGAGCGDNGGGALTMLNMDHDYKMRGHLSQYYASQVITREWVEPVDREHQVYRVASDSRDVTAYAVQRPDDEWSLMIINKDHDHPHTVTSAFSDQRHFQGPLRIVHYGAAQFQWHSAGADSYADPDLPPAVSTLPAGEHKTFTLPKASITVIRGRISGR